MMELAICVILCLNLTVHVVIQKQLKKIVNHCFHLNKMIRNEGHNTSINVTKLFLRISKNDQKLWLLL